MLYFVRSQPLPDQIFSTISGRTPHLRILPVTSTDFIHKNHLHFTRVSIRMSADPHVCILPWHWLQVRQDGTRKKTVTGPSVTTAPPIKYGLGYRSRS